jgi:hypothetical protein
MVVVDFYGVTGVPQRRGYDLLAKRTVDEKD